MAAGSLCERWAQMRETHIVLRLMCARLRSLWRMFHITGIPANHAASPPTKSAWYIQVCTRTGFDCLSQVDNRRIANGSGKPGRIPRDLTGIPIFRMRLPMRPSVVSETTSEEYFWRLIADSSRNNIISAPPVFRPVMTWKTFFWSFRRFPLPFFSIWVHPMIDMDGRIYPFNNHMSVWNTHW